MESPSLPLYDRGLSSSAGVLLPFIVIVAWLALNIGLNFFNKWILSKSVGFTFPIFFTMFHMVASCAGGFILIFAFKGAKVSWAQFSTYKSLIALLSVLFVLNITTNNASLMHLSLSVNQIVKSCVPLPTILLSIAFERDGAGRPRQYSTGIWGSLVVLIGGSILAVYGNPEASPFGLFLVITSTMCVALWSVTSAVLMNSPESGLNSINLTWYGSFFSGPILLCLWFFSPEREPTIRFLQERPKDAAAIIVVGSLAAFAYNIVHFALIKVSSALTSTVMGNVKIVLLIILSIILFERSVLLLNVVGFVVFFLGCSCYSYLAYNAKRRSIDTEARPTETTGLVPTAAAAAK